MKDVKRLLGLAALLADAVEHGTSAVERVHLATAARPFAVLERIPPTALVARGVHVTHDAIASGVYGSIRAVNRLARTAAALALEPFERGEPLPPPAAELTSESEDP